MSTRKNRREWGGKPGDVKKFYNFCSTCINSGLKFCSFMELFLTFLVDTGKMSSGLVCADRVILPSAFHFDPASIADGFLRLMWRFL